jgi:spore coat protein CotH
MKNYTYLVLVLLLHAYLFAQDESWKLYDDSNVARVDITIDPDTLEWIYNNVESEIEHYAFFHFQNNLINESVDSIGFRIRGNTSRYSAKKSFKVSFNTFIHGRKFYGVEKMNLNGEHNDPSIIRSKLCFDHFKTICLTASRANHVEVYINGKYYGLYISVEHIDDEFLKKNFSDDSGNLWKCLYPADLVYLGSDPEIYKNLISGDRPVYELKTNEEIGDFSKLVRLIDIINNTPDNEFADSVESVIEIPELLKYFSMNILFGSWDDYWSLANNYYLYHEPSRDIFQLIPYDYDNTYGIDWSGNDWSVADPYNFPKVVNGYRPLAERLMNNSQYRNLYTHFIQFYRNNVYQLNLWRNRIDSIKQMITPYAIADTFRTLDWGFTVSDFYSSYSETGYQNQHVKFGLKQFVNLRNNSLPGQLSFLTADPIVYKINFSPKYPDPNDSIYVWVSAFSNAGLAEVSIQLTKNGSTTTYLMSYHPVVNTKLVEESDRWIGVIPPLGAGNSASFKIHVRDSNNRSLLYPRKNAITITASIPLSNNLVVNELMADNDNTIQDPAGEYDDWFEIYNPASIPILLTGKYLTDKPGQLNKWRFTQTDLYLNPGEFLIIWCDEDSGQAGIHTNFALSKSGEYIAIVDTDGVSIIDSVTFGPQATDISYGRYPDAASNWYFMENPTPGSSNILSSVENEFIPTGFDLSVYPNPFNPSTTIQYKIPEMSNVDFKIYNILGREIWNFYDCEKPAGAYDLRWDGKNNSGQKVSSGIYLLKMTAGKYSKSYKIMLLK